MPGANGTIAGNDILSTAAAPEEMMSGGIAMVTLAPLVRKGMALNLADYKMVSGLIKEDWFLLVNTTKSGIKNWDDFEKYVKSHDDVIWSQNAPGEAGNMLFTALFGDMGVKSQNLTGNTAAKYMQAVLAGDALCTVITLSSALPYLGAEGDVITPIATFSDSPATDIGDFKAVPSIKSKGYDIVFKSFNFLFTRASVSDEAVNAVYDTIQKWNATPECQALCEKSHLVLDNSNPAECAKVLADSVAFCQRIYNSYYAKSN
jgi:tripartite-type tricarboxylate transporter receptor subunit TctC